MRSVSISAGCLWLFSVLAFGQSGTGSLTSKLIDITGAVVLQAHIKFESDRGDQYTAEPNSEGQFSFSRLIPGEYTLTASSRGFRNFTVRGIRIADGEQKTLPLLRLEIASMGCSSEPVVDYIRFLDGETPTGDFGGRIQLDEGPMKGEPQSIAGAEVRAICGWDVICGTATTDQNGEFRLTGLKPGKFKLQITRKGLYSLTEAGYKVDAGHESIYSPIYLEKCFRGDCNPSKRPKKPRIVCE